ncbi:MAG: 50S ribosomal protein L21 [Pseudomonadota bacterium]
MYAVIRTGGKQYKVAEGDEITIEKLEGAAGDAVDFAEVLMLGGDSVTVGAPLIQGASVQGEVVEQGRGPKVYTFHKRRRKSSSKRLRGHRQHLTTVRVTGITTA